MYIKLAERLIQVEPGIESYLRRPPFVDDLCLVDEQGSPLDFRTTTSPETLLFETSIGEFRLIFQDATTLVVGLPESSTAGIRFRIRPNHWHATETGGRLSHVRNATYSVNNGRVLKNRSLPDEDGMMVEFIVRSGSDCSIAIQIGDDPDPLHGNLPFSVVSASAKKRWEEWFNAAPQVAEKYRSKYAYAWWVMANNLIHPSGCVLHEAMMPTKAFYVGIWLWDSALHAVAFRHIDPELARNQIRVMLDHQLADGMLPDVVFDEGTVTEIDHPFHGRVTKPPIFAWAALKIHESSPDVDFLKEIYGPLVRCNAWWLDVNDDDNDGIVQYTHPYSSGLDDSPLWDHGMPVESPDINTYLVIQMNSLAKIAEIIDKPNEATEWKRKADEHLNRMIEHLWDEEAGVFHALHDGKPVPVLAPFNLYPLWTGQLPEGMAKRLLARLKDPQEFWGKYGLPTVAFNDPAFNPDKMWRGPIWANINYFFVEALEQIGERDLAGELCEKTLDLIAGHPDIREYYNPMTGVPPTTAAPIFGWSAAVFIDLAIKDHKLQLNGKVH
ncbi:MAG: hypothetical protein C3F07_09945 [Anaerolineales bacterium]|nr:hypothetical protein [Anaerolineae bacterium]PWB73168.1 MAG: hypothetical protein C3F07_09945 [Anaerolineales bacterium]